MMAALKLPCFRDGRLWETGCFYPVTDIDDDPCGYDHLELMGTDTWFYENELFLFNNDLVVEVGSEWLRQQVSAITLEQKEKESKRLLDFDLEPHCRVIRHRHVWLR